MGDIERVSEVLVQAERAATAVGPVSDLVSGGLTLDMAHTVCEENIQKRLDAITVDPKTVTLAAPEKGPGDAATAAVPLPAVDAGLLGPMSLAYKGTLMMGDRKIDLDITRLVSKAALAGAPSWRVITTQSSGAQSAVDTFDLDATTLLPRRWAVSQGPALVNKGYKQLGITLPLYHAHGVASEEFIKLSGPAGEGVRLPAAALLVADKLPANDPQKAVATAYRKAYSERYKEDVSTFGGHAYDAMKILVKAIETAGADKEKVRDSIENMKGFVGTGGVFNFSATDHNGLDKSAFEMLTVKKGKFVVYK